MKSMNSRSAVNSMTHHLLCLVLILCFGSFPVWAEQTSSNTAQERGNAGITPDALQARIEALNARQGLDEALKTKMLKFYQSAQDNLANAEKFSNQAAGFKEAVAKAPDKTRRLQKQIDQLQQKLAKQKIEDFSNIPIAELEQRLILERGKVSSLDEQIKKLEDELMRQNSRPQLIREEIVAAEQALDSARKQLDLPAGNADAKPELEAWQMQLKTLIESRAAELKMLEIEAMSNPARVEQIKAELQLLNVEKAALTPVVSAIENLLAERHLEEAREVQEALSQAEKEIAGKHAVIQVVTRENIQLSRDLQIITTKIDKYAEQKNRVDEQSTEISNDFKSAEKKISLAGLSPALGKILREQRRNLPTEDQFAQQSQTIQNETALTSLEQFKVEDKLKKLTNIDDELRMFMEQVDAAMPADRRMMIQAELRMLLDSQKDLLNKLSADYTTYLRTLGDLDFARQQMIKQAGSFAVYLDERLLWVPSSAPIDSDFIVDLYHSIQWLLSPHNWLAVAKDTFRVALQNLFLSIIALFVMTVSILARNWAKRQLTAISQKVEKIYTDKFNYTLEALAYTLVLVLPLPLFLYYLGWFLAAHAHIDDFSRSVGAGLQGIAAPWFFLEFFYRLFAAKGIARKHFQWQESTTGFLRSQIAWIRFIVLPALFTIHAAEASSISSHSDNLGRLALIIVMMVMAVFVAKALKPSSGLLRDYIKDNSDGWVARLRYIWYPASILVPVIVIGFAAAGYYQSAVELQQKLTVTLRLLFVSAIVHQMVVRWLTLVNRQLALKNVRQKRKSAASSSTKQAAAGAEDPVLPGDEELIDIPKINAQTTKLLNVFIGFGLVIGFWMIWENILPAFSFLDNIVLWQHQVIADGEESYQPITLTNLLLAGLYVFIVIVSVRNFSGVVEILIFRRISVAAGSRYAVNQLAKYVLVSIGFISVANELGGSWSQVQWLVAALSVGLGFGLQEIFANLVSGIILLFERPVRVGDTVTIGDISGKVSRIQMRATTLIDWDQKELIVPNKTFITSQLVNWTLSDATTRVVIPVGIAYGSDVGLAHKVMIDTVRSIPQVLADPEPGVVFVGFGESSLDFSIRVYVSELANRVPVTHDLLVRLDQAFRDNNIEIPLPQRDIHVRSIVREAKIISSENVQPQ